MNHLKLKAGLAAGGVLVASAVMAAPLAIGPVVVDTAVGLSAASVSGVGASGTFSANPSPTFAALPGVTTFGQAAGGEAGSALFIGESGQSPDDNVNFFSNTVLTTFAAPIFNNPGADVAVFVSGAENLTQQTSTQGPTVPVGTFGFQETLSVRVAGSGAPFFYTDAAFFTSTGQQATSGSTGITFDYGYHTYLYDLSDLGVALGGSITQLELANFSAFATVTGGSGDGFSGFVDPTGLNGVPIQGGISNDLLIAGFDPGDVINGLTASLNCTGGVDLPAGTTANSYCSSPSLVNASGANVYAASFDTDPDLLYAAGLQGSVAPVPLPAAAWFLLAGVGALVAAGRRARA